MTDAYWWLSLENATEAERMQAMGHADPNIYRRHYLNQIVTTDTLACFLGAPSREGIMRLASHMSLTRDVNAPTALSQSQRDEIRANPVLSAAQSSRDTARSELIKQHRRLKVAREADPSGYTQYQRLQRAAEAVETKLRRKMLTEVRERFFASAGARYIEQQNVQSRCASDKLSANTDDALAATTLSVPEFEITERNAVRKLLFEAHTTTLKQEGGGCTGLCDVVRAFRALCLRTGRPSKPSEVLFECLAEEEICHNERFPETFPIVVPGTVCLFCLGNVSLTASARTYAYARRSSLARHVQQHHLQYQRSEFPCPHPTCSAEGIRLQDGMHFKNHAATVHNVLHWSLSGVLFHYHGGVV
jgi:Protein of unknown function (DUF3435)